MVNRQQPIANRQSQIANQESLLLSCQAVISRKSRRAGRLFMQNKPNFQDVQLNVSIFSKMAYENKQNWTLCENKPNQTQSQYLTYPQRAKIKHAVATAEAAKLLPWLDCVVCLRVSGSLTNKKHKSFCPKRKNSSLAKNSKPPLCRPRPLPCRRLIAGKFARKARYLWLHKKVPKNSTRTPAQSALKNSLSFTPQVLYYRVLKLSKWELTNKLFWET